MCEACVQMRAPVNIEICEFASITCAVYGSFAKPEPFSWLSGAAQLSDYLLIYNMYIRLRLSVCVYACHTHFHVENAQYL